MTHRTAVLLAAIAFLTQASTSSFGQTPRPEDVSSIDGIIRAYYDVVSGPAGEAADAERDRSLHHPDAWVAIAGVDSVGTPYVNVVTLDEYYGDNKPRQEGFYEWETDRVVSRSGNMAHVWSSYASARTPDGEPFDRGVNSITLFHDGSRWWIMGWMFDRSADAGPSFSCDDVRSGSIEELICQDDELSALDRQLASTYAAASANAENEHPPMLAAEQRGWIKGRDECWKSDNKRECVTDEYIRRIAELQARYRLVSANGPFRWTCDGNPANEIVVTFFETSPQTLIAERGDSISLMFREPSASGARFVGRNESFWEHQGEATIVWGYDAPKMTCRKAD